MPFVFAPQICREPQQATGCAPGQLRGRCQHEPEDVVLNSRLIGKIEKARRYADERDRRVRFRALTVTVAGENDAHEVQLADGKLTCACDFYAGWGVCSHTMAIERILGPMLPKEALSDASSPVVSA